MDARNIFMKIWQIQFCIVLQDTSFPKDDISSEDNENLNAFFNQYKRRFFLNDVARKDQSTH